MALVVAVGVGPVAARPHHKKHASSPTLAGSKAQLEQVHKKLAQTRKKVQILRKKEHQAVNDLTVLQQRLETTTVQLEDSQFRLSRAKHQLSITKLALGDAKRKFKVEQQLAGERLRTIYKHRQTDYWEALLTAPDLDNFLTRYQYLKHISESDADLLNRLDRRMVEIGHQEHRVHATMQTIATITANISQQKDQIQSDTVDQAKTLAQIRSERAAAEAAEAKLERDSRLLEAMVRRLMTARRHMPRMGGGRLSRPCDGSLGDLFGMRYHPILHVYRPHKGVDFRAPVGSPIRAADRGVVIFSGWFGSFGKVVIIDHGGDLSTLYAHASRLVVERGQTVERGQLIAYVGTTGLSTGAHLHFEVHVRGGAVNPLGYLR
jgi:murein DD-endopeptidase MepM/ murein hydrolase activator NlpD